MWYNTHYSRVDNIGALYTNLAGRCTEVGITTALYTNPFTIWREDEISTLYIIQAQGGHDTYTLYHRHGVHQVDKIEALYTTCRWY